MSKISQNPTFNAPIARKSIYENENVPKAYKEIAVGMERQFIRHMIDQMQKTVKSQEEEGPGAAYYKSLMADERSKIMAEVNNGIGLKEIILDQIVPSHLKNQPTGFDAVKMYNKSTKVQGEN